MNQRAVRHGFTLIELMIVVAIIGILAAIAIPNFIKFQARSKQSEVKGNLKAFFQAEQSVYQEKEFYSSILIEVGFAPERGNRYAYYAGAAPACQPRLLAGMAATGPADNCIEVDKFRYPQAVVQPAPEGGALVSFPGLTGRADPAAPPGSAGIGAGLCPDCNITMTAAGQVDNEAAGVDSWYVSTKDSTNIPTPGCGPPENVPGGAPANTYNDVNCDT